MFHEGGVVTARRQTDNQDSGQEPVSHIERSDPFGAYRASIAQGELLKDPLARSMVEALGAPPEVLDQMLEATDKLRWLLGGNERWAPLTQLGWGITDAAKPEVYDEAVRLLRSDQPEEAESLLEQYWNESGCLETAAMRVLRTATYSEVRMRVGRERYRLFEEAVHCHRDGRYAAALGIVVPQTEGIVREVGLSSPYEHPSNLVDDVSTGGHPAILKTIFELSRASVRKTTLKNEGPFPQRHPIEHGRSVAYDSPRSSTKAFVAAAELATCQARIREAYEGGKLEELDRQVFSDT
jgi:hypothetical protein